MKNLNTISNFSQSWQRATQFLDPIPPQHEDPEAFSTTEAVEAEDQFATFDEDERSPCSRPHIASRMSSYGTIGCGTQLTGGRRSSSMSGHFRAFTNLGEDATGYCRLFREKIYAQDEDSNGGEGKSTVPMTIFNCTNMLVGIGILALPLGIQQCGWLVGLLLLTLPAVVTAYTAKLLVKCLDTDTRADTYGDIAHLAFGAVGRHIVEALFLIELVAANVALVILFADSVSSLLPVLTVCTWKIVIGIGLIPLNFAPLRLMSISSAIGIFCFVGVLMIIVATGLTKPETPGSLWQTADTRLLPLDWRAVPATFGLFMAPWGGHSIVPAVYKDMRHPQKYGTALKYTYAVTYTFALSISVLGYLMFGDGVFTEITSNILNVQADYPPVLSAMTLGLVSMVPLTKIALTNRPLMDTVNRKLGIDAINEHVESSCLDNDKSGQRKRHHRFSRVAVGALCNLVQLGLAIAVPNFDDVVALMGSALCITICLVLPAAFHLRICRDKGKGTSVFDQVSCWMLIVLGTVCALCGTVFALGVDDRSS